jgi:hypothetical protein
MLWRNRHRHTIIDFNSQKFNGQKPRKNMKEKKQKILKLAHNMFRALKTTSTDFTWILFANLNAQAKKTVQYHIWQKVKSYFFGQ